MNNVAAYETLTTTETRNVKFYFESDGNRPITKVIEYSYVTRRKGQPIYNLGFGDLDEATNTFSDNVNSNNGDMHRVFSTVLNTVPKFFRLRKDAVLWVQGSDSVKDFTEMCRPKCKKKCKDVCRNFHRRIKTYRYYVNKHFVELSKEYIFFGMNNDSLSSAVQYVPGNEYVGILIFRKK